MKKFSSLVLLCLSLVATGARNVSAQQVQQLDPEWLTKMYEEGWRKVQEGVLQRGQEGGPLESFGYGSEGLQWIMLGYEQQVSDLEEKHSQSPREHLALAIARLKDEIARLNETLAVAPSADRVDNTALATCAPVFGGESSAGPQPGPLGVVAAASAYFHSDCGQLGDTFAMAYAHAIEGTLETTQIQSDPKNGGSWLGSQTNASAHGSTGCESSAQASVTSSELSISYQTALTQNFSCVYDISKHQLVVDIIGPTQVQVDSSSPSSCHSISYWVNVTGGSEYTVSWYRGTAHVATYTAYSVSFCGQPAEQTINLKVFVRDAEGRTGEDTHTTSLYYPPQ